MQYPRRSAPFASTLFVAITLLTPSVFFGDQDDILHEWFTRTEKIDDYLLKSEWKKARKKSEVLLDEMVNRIVRGAGAPKLLGQVAIRQAIAFSGEGKTDDATWTMQVALQILPSLRELPLDRYGAAGKHLEKVAVRMLGEYPEAEKDRPRPQWPDDVEIKPLKRVKGHKPDFPWAKRSGGAFHVIVEVIVGVDGIPRHPVIEKADGVHTAVYTVLNEMRQWRFKPVRANGQPTEAFYELRVNFRP